MTAVECGVAQTAMKTGVADEIRTFKTVEHELEKLTPGIQAFLCARPKSSGVDLLFAFSSMLSVISNALQQLGQ